MKSPKSEVRYAEKVEGGEQALRQPTATVGTDDKPRLQLGQS